ncbi:MAG: hypothetical protein ACRDZW_04055, partial [Acidimicrobiales bacterium]
MSATAVRTLVVLLCLAGIAAMIVTSVTDHDGAALTFGLVTAAATGCLIAVTAAGSRPVEPAEDEAGEAGAARVEAIVADLIAEGAPEEQVRRL